MGEGFHSTSINQICTVKLNLSINIRNKWQKIINACQFDCKLFEIYIILEIIFNRTLQNYMQLHVILLKKCQL